MPMPTSVPPIGTVSVDPSCVGLHVGYRFRNRRSMWRRSPPHRSSAAAAATAGGHRWRQRDRFGRRLPELRPPAPGSTRAAAELDSDGDGVVDSADQCPGTPAGGKGRRVRLQPACPARDQFDTNPRAGQVPPDLERVAKFMADVPRVRGELETAPTTSSNDKGQRAPVTTTRRRGQGLAGVEGHRPGAPDDPGLR